MTDTIKQIDDVLHEIKAWEGDNLSQFEAVLDNKNFIETALTVLQKIASGDDWFPICDAPRDGTPYLARTNDREAAYTWWSEVTSCLGDTKMGFKTLNGYWANFGHCQSPTHWKPLDGATHIKMMIEKELNDGK